MKGLPVWILETCINTSFRVTEVSRMCPKHWPVTDLNLPPFAGNVTLRKTGFDLIQRLFSIGLSSLILTDNGSCKGSPFSLIPSHNRHQQLISSTDLNPRNTKIFANFFASSWYTSPLSTLTSRQWGNHDANNFQSSSAGRAKRKEQGVVADAKALHFWQYKTIYLHCKMLWEAAPAVQGQKTGRIQQTIPFWSFSALWYYQHGRSDRLDRLWWTW